MDAPVQQVQIDVQVQVELPPLPDNFVDAMEKAKTVQRPLTWEWALAERFLAGDQNAGGGRAGQLYAIPARSMGTSAASFNILMPFFRSKIAMLDIWMPDVAVRPLSPTQDDIRKAQNTQLLVNDLWDSKEAEKFIKRAIAMCVRIGTSGIQTYYDQAKADFCLRAHSAYNLRFEAGAVNDDEASWKSCRTLWKKDDALAAYPDHAEAIEQSVISSYGSTDTRRPNYTASSDQVPKDSVEIWDVYFKNGAHGVWCGDTWLDHKEYPKGSDPLVILRYEEMPDRIYGQGLIWPLIDSQRVFTRVVQRIVDMVESMANPVWLNPTTSGVSRGSFNNVIGGVIPYNMAGGKPTRENGVEVPQTVFELVKLIQANMQDIASSHNQSMGKRTTGLNSGVAIETITSNDQDQMTYTEWNIGHGVSTLMKTLVIYARETWTESKMTRMFSPMGPVEYQELQATDLVENPDVAFELDTLFKHRIAAREDKMMQMVQLGVMTPQDMQKKSITRAWGMDSAKAMMRSFKAKTIVDMVKQQMPLEVYPSDPLEEVLEQLDNFMMSPEF